MNSAHTDRASPGPEDTPGTDMQAEDAGTAASGSGGRGTAVEGAMKQTAKTPAEAKRREGEATAKDGASGDGTP